LYFNEYWVKILIVLVINVIIHKLKAHKKKMAELEKLRQQIERYNRQTQILCIVCATTV